MTGSHSPISKVGAYRTSIELKYSYRYTTITGQPNNFGFDVLLPALQPHSEPLVQHGSGDYMRDFGRLPMRDYGGHIST